MEPKFDEDEYRRIFGAYDSGEPFSDRIHIMANADGGEDLIELDEIGEALFQTTYVHDDANDVPLPPPPSPVPELSYVSEPTGRLTGWQMPRGVASPDKIHPHTPARPCEIRSLPGGSWIAEEFWKCPYKCPFAGDDQPYLLSTLPEKGYGVQIGDVVTYCNGCGTPVAVWNDPFTTSLAGRLQRSFCSLEDLRFRNMKQPIESIVMRWREDVLRIEDCDGPFCTWVDQVAYSQILRDKQGHLPVTELLNDPLPDFS